MWRTGAWRHGHGARLRRAVVALSRVSVMGLALGLGRVGCGLGHVLLLNWDTSERLVHGLGKQVVAEACSTLPCPASSVGPKSALCCTDES